MEERQYILNDAPNIDKNTRGYYQRNLDMVAFYYLATLALGHGNPYNSEDDGIIAFFEGKKDFPKTRYSKEIQTYLRNINDNWKRYQNSPAIAKIAKFIQDTCRSKLANGERPFDTLMGYYSKDRNREYISVEKVFADICAGGKDESICAELDVFLDNLQKHTAEDDELFADFLKSKKPEDESGN